MTRENYSGSYVLVLFFLVPKSFGAGTSISNVTAERSGILARSTLIPAAFTVALRSRALDEALLREEECIITYLPYI